MGHEAKVGELRVEANERGKEGDARDREKCPTKASWWRFEEDYRTPDVWYLRLTQGNSFQLALNFMNPKGITHNEHHH